MVRYFERGLKPSIKAEIDQNNIQLVDYEELVAKTIRVEAKAGLRPSFYLRKTNENHLQGNRPVYTTVYKVQMQGTMNWTDDSKATKAPVSASTQDSEPFNEARKYKKKK